MAAAEDVFDNDGKWQRFAGVGAVQAVTDTEGPSFSHLRFFRRMPVEFFQAFLKLPAVASEEEMEDLIPRLSEGDFFRCPGEVTVKEGLTVDRMWLMPEENADLSRRLRRADQVVGGLAGFSRL